MEMSDRFERGRKPLFDSPDQARMLRALATDYPPQPEETALHYIERLALLGGLVKERAIVKETEDLKTGRRW
jgi:hypothetical protein